MKKRNKIFLSIFSFAFIGSLLVGCGGTTPEEETPGGETTQEPTEGETGEEETEQAQIDDVYDWNEDYSGSTRPDFGNDFDYDSEYEPDVPVLDAKVEVKTDLPEGIRFTDEYAALLKDVPVRENLDLPTEDDVINETGLKIGGWLLYSPENDTYSRAGDTLYIDGRTEYVLTCYLVEEDCDAAMPFRRTNSGSTISDPTVYIPATETEGASLGEALTLDGDFNYNKEYKIGDKYGKRLTYSGTLENTYFRFFSSDPNKEYVVPREGGWYRVNYTLQNFSDEEITLQLSQIPGTNRYFDADGGKTSEFVTLKAGETVDISLENFLENDPWNSAGNLQQRHFITGVVITNAVSKMDLGFAMSYKAIESPVDPDPEPSFENFDITFGNDLVTYNGANKVTVDSEDFAYPANSDLTLSSKVTGGKTIAGWYYYSDGNKVKVNDLASLEATSAMTVYPYFTTETGYTSVFFGNGKSSNVPNYASSDFAARPDGLNNTQSEDWVEARFSPTDNATVVNGKDNVAMIGSTIKYTQQASGEELKSGDYFRYDTKVAPLPNVEIGKTYSYIYNFENFGEERVSFTLQQINNGIDPESSTNNKITVTLDPGKSGTARLNNVTVNKTYNNAPNGNTLSLITIQSESLSSLNLGISLSMKEGQDETPAVTEINEVTEVTEDVVVTIGSQELLTSEKGYSFTLDGNTTLPANSDFGLTDKVTNGRTLAGWYYEDSEGRHKIDNLSSLQDTTTDVTVYPYFSTEAGYTNVFFGSGKNGNIPNSSGANFAAKPDGLNENWLKARFSATDNATVVNGKDNVAMIGSTIKYTQQASGEELKSGDYFRYDTKVAPLPNVEIGKTYSYIYNFENFGEERVSFTLQQINNGIDSESSTNNKITVTLDPGTSGTARLNNVTVNKTYNNAPNGNTLSLITIQSESLSSLNLGISLSMKEGQDETPAITEIDTTTPSVNYQTVTIGNSNLLTSTSGFSFELDGETTLPGNDAFSANTDLTDGRTLAGWYYDDASGRHTLENLSSLQNSETDVTVYPYFGNVPGYNQLDLCNEQDDRKPVNYFFAANPNPNEGNKEYANAHFSPIKLGTLVNGTDGVAEIGSRIACDTQIVKGDYFRLNSTGPHPKDDNTNDVLSGHTYSFIFNLENFGDERISLQINQINSGVDLTSTTNNQATVTLDPGCSGTIRLNVTYKGNNANLLTLITVLSDSIDNLNLGMSAHYKEGAADKVVNQLEVLNS